MAMWRRMLFEKLGFREHPAHRLALSDARPDDAERMLERGATHDQVLRILE